MSDSSDDDEKRSNRKAKSALDIQRLRLEKLMSDPVFDPVFVVFFSKKRSFYLTLIFF